jgi:hypothetical protein
MMDYDALAMEIAQRMPMGLDESQRAAWVNEILHKHLNSGAGVSEVLDLVGLDKLTKDLREAPKTLKEREVRFLVDTYYVIQKSRVSLNNQIEALKKSGEPNRLLPWLFKNIYTYEKNIKTALAIYSPTKRMGRWAESITGIGPVISAGLLAHLTLRPWWCVNHMSVSQVPCHSDAPCTKQCHFEETHTIGHIWKFAGLLPPDLQPWDPHEKRPWNASLRTLCWKIGKSFVMFSSNPNDHYGKIWASRKALEQKRNESGMFKELAARELAAKNYGRDTNARKAYEKGLLPAGRIDARARRYAVKLFLSHYFHCAHTIEFGVEPPKPYTVEHLGHADMIRPPNWPID